MLWRQGLNVRALCAVVVCYARPGQVWQVEIELPVGSTLGDALQASGFARAFPNVDPGVCAVGVFGKRFAQTRVLADGDRVEIYRPLTFDPKDSRRRRARHNLLNKTSRSR